jgi:hypothetical protein
MLVSGLLHSCAFGSECQSAGASCVMSQLQWTTQPVAVAFLSPCSSPLAGFKELHDKFRGQPFEIVGEQSVACAS